MCAKCKFRFRIRCGPQSGAVRGPVSNRHNHHLGSMLERGGKAKFLEWGKSGSGEFFWKRAQNLEARWCFREKHTKMRIQAFNKPTTQKNEKKNRHTTASKKLLSKNAGRRGAQAELRSSPPSALARFAGSGLRPSAGFRWVGPAALGRVSLGRACGPRHPAAVSLGIKLCHLYVQLRICYFKCCGFGFDR